LNCDIKTKAEILVKQFESVFTIEDENVNLPDIPIRIEETLPILNISTGGVFKLLKNLDISKAVGPDELPTKVFQYCAEDLAPAVSTLFHISINTGNLPSDWRKAFVSPVFKMGTDTVQKTIDLFH
jgi:hypothetical protein